MLKPGGRLAISDVVALNASVRASASVEAMTGCVAGSAKVAQLEALLKQPASKRSKLPRPESSAIIASGMPGAMAT